MQISVDKKRIPWNIRGWLERILFPAVLLLYPLRHVHLGVEWWDTGYNYGNFTYIERMDSMWVFSTYLGNALGHLFTGLPFGDCMLGLNIYTGLLVSGLALLGYWFFTKVIRLPSWVAFWGELLAISLCWCPTALLYNYLGYVLMALGAVLLYLGLLGSKPLYLAAAGAFLGINVLVRFPNLAQMGLIAGLWLYVMWIEGEEEAVPWGKRFLSALRQTGWCVLGYGAGLGAGLAYIVLRYGLDTYVGAILRLFSMPSEAGEYTLYSMVVYQIQNYMQNLLWARFLVAYAIVGLAVFGLLQRVIKQKSALYPAAKLAYCAGIPVLFYYLMLRNMYNLKYTTKMSMFQWAVFLLTAALVTGAISIFRKGGRREERLLFAIILPVILITPLGSNNHLYSSINNLFLAAPLILWKLVGLWRSRREFPLKALGAAVLAMITVQSLCFGWSYVFSESDGGENLNTRIENNDILKGMYTSPDRAQVLESLYAYISGEELVGKEIICYGNIPSLPYYLGMPFAISAWPDLPSYNYQVMEGDMKKLTASIDRGERGRPVLLLDRIYGLYLLEGDGALEGADVSDSLRVRLGRDRKLELLRELIEQYGYIKAFENDKFILLKAE